MFITPFLSNYVHNQDTIIVFNHSMDEMTLKLSVFKKITERERERELNRVYGGKLSKIFDYYYD